MFSKVMIPLVTGFVCFSALAQDVPAPQVVVPITPASPASAASAAGGGKELAAFEIGAEASRGTGTRSNSEAAKHERMVKELARACVDKAGCVVTAIKCTKKGFSGGVNFGNGNNNGTSGTNVYYGATPYQNQNSFGASLIYSDYETKVEVLFPMGWTETVFAYGQSMLDENGNPIHPMGSDNKWMTSFMDDITKQIAQTACNRQ